MQIGVPRETAPHERRVALVPDSVARLVKSGLTVAVERCAGVAAFHTDEAYAAAGASIVDADAALGESDIVTKVQPPSAAEAVQLREGTVLISLLQPATNVELLAKLADRGVASLSLERVPRITRAQSMDVLSSQATVAGYKAVLLGAAHLGRFLPMLTTAAGSIPPARTLVLGAGVAGLQAIATARRLGAMVSAFDVRAAVREQVHSLGATFIAAELVSAEAEDKGGYAKAQSEDQQQRTIAVIGRHIVEMDLVISTAQIPNRRAPMLITEEMVRSMKPGSVIVDLAAESGGNCAVTRLGESIEVGAVTVMGPHNVPASMPYHASQMFSRNVFTLLQHLLANATLTIDPADEITGAMLLTHAGQLLVR